MTNSFLNLKNGILFLTLISIVGITAIISYISYRSQEHIYEKETLIRLKAISQTLASQIDGDDLFHLYQKYPNIGDFTESTEDSIYKKIQQKLRIAQEMHELTSPIYTLIYHPSDTAFHLGVTSAEKPYWMHLFKKFPKQLLDKYQSSGVVRPYESENGMWLSAFCAIHKSDHTTHVGVVQVDIEFDDFRKKALGTLYTNLIITLLIVGIIGIMIFFSISTLLKRQEELREVEQNLSIYRKELIANVSHDLRTPLTSIQGYLETLLMPELELSQEVQNKYLNTALTNTARLKNLVNELFELSRIESKDRKLKVESFHLAELVQDLLIGLQYQSDENNIEIINQITSQLPKAKGDVALIERIFQNLLSNAIKYCPPGSSIKVSAVATVKHLHVEVEDNGIGMKEEDLAIVFERVYKGKNKKSGTGLGLAIVKGILELHGSSYSVNNNSEGGLTFKFTLPRCPMSKEKTS